MGTERDFCGREFNRTHQAQAPAFIDFRESPPGSPREALRAQSPGEADVLLTSHAAKAAEASGTVAVRLPAAQDEVQPEQSERAA